MNSPDASDQELTAGLFMCGLLARCAALILMIHGLRALGRAAGPRWSGLALGLPSTTAIVLIFCGCEQGSGAAIRMTEASLLGLVAAVALPLAYAHAARCGWPLPAVLVAAVAAYAGVASCLGYLPPIGALERLTIASSALLAAAYWARRIPLPAFDQTANLVPGSAVRTMVLRTVIPALFMFFLAGVEHFAGTGWAGLMSTFPSMSLVVLLVTYVEVGPVPSSRIALVLPAANTSTAAFLAAFRLACPEVGLSCAVVLGYMAALVALVALEGFARYSGRFEPAAWGRSLRSRVQNVPWRIPSVAGRPATMLRIHTNRPAGRESPYLIRRRMQHRGEFSPLVEALAW
jgi:hypothetical protein